MVLLYWCYHAVFKCNIFNAILTLFSLQPTCWEWNECTHLFSMWLLYERRRQSDGKVVQQMAGWIDPVQTPTLAHTNGESLSAESHFYATFRLLDSHFLPLFATFRSPFSSAPTHISFPFCVKLAIYRAVIDGVCNSIPMQTKCNRNLISNRMGNALLQESLLLYANNLIIILQYYRALPPSFLFTYTTYVFFFFSRFQTYTLSVGLTNSLAPTHGNSNQRNSWRLWQ